MGDPTRMVVAQMARVFLAPVGTPAPDGPTAILDPDWVEVGLFTPDSLQFATSPSFEDIRSHQSLYPTRRVQTEDAATMQTDLQEWSGSNFQAVFGGGTVEQITPAAGGGAPYFEYHPPGIGGRANVAAIIEIIDGSKHYRRIIPRAMQSEGVEQTFQPTTESTLPLRLTVLGSDVGDPWYDQSDDPAFTPAA